MMDERETILLEDLRMCHFCEHSREINHPRIVKCTKKERTVAFYAARECPFYTTEEKNESLQKRA